MSITALNGIKCHVFSGAKAIVMKILHVVRQYEPAVGGLESYVRAMAQHQKALGHEIVVLTLNRIFQPSG